MCAKFHLCRTNGAWDMPVQSLRFQTFAIAPPIGPDIWDFFQTFRAWASISVPSCVKSYHSVLGAAIDFNGRPRNNNNNNNNTNNYNRGLRPFGAWPLIIITLTVTWGASQYNLLGLYTRFPFKTAYVVRLSLRFTCERLKVYSAHMTQWEAIAAVQIFWSYNCNRLNGHCTPRVLAFVFHRRELECKKLL